MYGIALTKNEEAAAEYFRQAADLGLADAQTAFGIMLVQGLGELRHYYVNCMLFIDQLRYYLSGTPQDFVEAEKYFRRAVDQDNTNGMWLLAKYALLIV